MKRGKYNFVSLLVSASLALTPPTYAQLGNVSGSSVSNDTVSSFSEADTAYQGTNIIFGGQNLSWRVVKDIAKDPVVRWGAVRNDNGETIQGEVWLIIAKSDKFIYFHLTDEPKLQRIQQPMGGTP